MSIYNIEHEQAEYEYKRDCKHLAIIQKLLWICLFALVCAVGAWSANMGKQHYDNIVAENECVAELVAVAVERRGIVVANGECWIEE